MHWQTHTVFNQPSPLSNSNLFLSDRALCEAVNREGDYVEQGREDLGTRSPVTAVYGGDLPNGSVLRS